MVASRSSRSSRSSAHSSASSSGRIALYAALLHRPAHAESPQTEDALEAASLGEILQGDAAAENPIIVAEACESRYGGLMTVCADIPNVMQQVASQLKDGAEQGSVRLTIPKDKLTAKQLEALTRASEQPDRATARVQFGTEHETTNIDFKKFTIGPEKSREAFNETKNVLFTVGEKDITAEISPAQLKDKGLKGV